MARARSSSQTFDDGKIESAAGTAAFRVREQEPWLTGLPKDFETVLDLGAGAGAHSKWFLDRGHVPVAADRYAKAFRYGESIEFIQKDLDEMDDGRQFDAVFCSHVVEHFPDPAASIRKMREMIKPGGYLFVVVPPYIPVVVNHHWHVGWNCTQLAMLLAACGFDCSQSTFMELGLNVCGWGRKVEVEPTKFHLRRSMPLLPAGVRDTFYMQGEDEFFAGDLAIAGPGGSIRKPVDTHFEMPGLDPADALSLGFGEGEWKFIERPFDGQGLDLSGGDIRMVIETTAQADPAIRLAVASDGENGRWGNSAQRYLGAKPGVSCHRFGPNDLLPIEGVREAPVSPNLSDLPDFSAITHLSLGGWGAHAQVRIWMVLPDGTFLR
jgi:SAM-dependent methyltransferase